MKKPLRYASVCSGVGTCKLAWAPLGWETAFFSEFAEFPKTVLKHRWPDVPDLGDMTAEDWLDRAKALGPIDVLAGGPPCQAFSIAGLRASLTDARGNITLLYARYIHELDAHQRANGRPDGLPITVFENVPGLLSTPDNAFGCFLGGLCGSGAAIVPPRTVTPKRWRARKNGTAAYSWPDAGVVVGPARSAAWRTLDAQHFGLAQRRRRVIVVSCSRTSGLDPAEILLEFDGVRRDRPARGEAGQGAAAAARSGAGGGGSARAVFGGNRTGGECSVAPALNAKGGSGRMDFETEAQIVERVECQAGEVTHPLTTNCGIATESCIGKGNGAPLIPDAIYQCQGTNVGPLGALRTGHNESRGVPFTAECVTGEVTHALKAEGADASEDGTGRGNPIVAAVCHDDPRRYTGVHGGGDHGDLHPTLEATNPKQVVATAETPVFFDPNQITSWANRSNPQPGEPCHTLPASTTAPAIASRLAVRRLTPVECERLQGYPDHHTLVPRRSPKDKDAERLLAYLTPEVVGRRLGKPAAEVTAADIARLAADGPRYKAIGNGWAAPVFRWLGERIQRAWDASRRQQAVDLLPPLPTGPVNVSNVPQRSPFRYPGGKSWLTPYLRRWLAENPARVFVDAFAGGGSSALTAVMEDLCEHAVMVENDPAVGAVWQVITTGDWVDLCRRITDFKVTEANVREALARDREPTSREELAFQTILRNRMQRGGVMAPGAGLLRGGENGRGLLSRWYPETLCRRIGAIAAVRDRLTFHRADAMALLPRIAACTDHALFCDPPYTKAGSRLYGCHVVHHGSLFALAAAHQGPVLMTYDDTHQVRELAILHGLVARPLAMRTTHHAVKSELAITRT